MNFFGFWLLITKNKCKFSNQVPLVYRMTRDLQIWYKTNLLSIIFSDHNDYREYTNIGNVIVTKTITGFCLKLKKYLQIFKLDQIIWYGMIW